jgi:hypothetical protein
MPQKKRIFERRDFNFGRRKSKVVQREEGVWIY